MIYLNISLEKWFQKYPSLKTNNKKKCLGCKKLLIWNKPFLTKTSVGVESAACCEYPKAIISIGKTFQHQQKRLKLFNLFMDMTS